MTNPSWVALGRDETGIFRGVEVNTSLADLDTARTNLHQRLLELSAGQAQEFPQGDNDRKKHEILVPAVPPEKLHPNFVHLSTSPNYSPARELIRELSFAFKDRDGNYRKDFQTTGFMAGSGRLSLRVPHQQKFLIDDSQAVPDFLGEERRRSDRCGSGYSEPNPGCDRAATAGGRTRSLPCSRATCRSNGAAP